MPMLGNDGFCSGHMERLMTSRKMKCFSQVCAERGSGILHELAKVWERGTGVVGCSHPRALKLGA